MGRRISNYLINRKMQFRITFKYLLVALTASFLTGFMVYMTIWPVMKDYVPYPLVMGLQRQILIRLALYSCLLILFVVACCVVITHRIAGPLYNMEQKLDKLIGGEDVDLIVTRRGDELKELVKKLNDLILMLKVYKK